VFLEQPELIYAVFIAFFIANIALIPLGFMAIRLARQILHVPRRVLMPVILMFCIVGAFAINNTVFGVTVMLIMGVMAYVMEENGFPVAPTILGIVLGPMLEENFMSSLIKADGSFLGFFSRPIAATLGVLFILLWLVPLVSVLRGRRPVSADVR
jgi:TctA family transporter